jgi:hypothetical protein
MPLNNDTLQPGMKSASRRRSDEPDPILYTSLPFSSSLSSPPFVALFIARVSNAEFHSTELFLGFEEKRRNEEF